MKWLIVEDALRDRWGHWLEYDAHFMAAIPPLGDDVVLLCDRKAETDVVASLGAVPALPQSIWHRMSDKAGPLRRYLRLPAHAVATFFAMRRYFAENRDAGDLIFVPTVLVHHLLGWYWLLKSGSCPEDARVLLFFPNLPLEMNAAGDARWNGSPTTRLMAWLFGRLRPWVEERRVILGAETETMRQSLAQLTGLPVIYLPHPIEVAASDPPAGRRRPGDPLLFACYGTARAEKGSDVLQDAIHLMAREPEGSPPVRFAIQWIAPFTTDDGREVHIAEDLAESGKVEFIRRFFVENEYEERLRRTDAMVLPYLASSYNVRVSRIVIEAMVHGIPVIASEGTTVWDQARKYGAGLPCREKDPESLLAAMRQMTLDFDDFARRAAQAAEGARAHFSVANFRRLLLDHIAADRLLIGDSHVARWHGGSAGDGTWTYGVEGITSGGLFGLLAHSRIPQPRSVVVWIGTNDVLQGVDPAMTLGNVRRIAGHFPDALRAGRVALAEVLPVGTGTAGSQTANPAIRALNVALEVLAQEMGIHWIPTPARLVTEDGALNKIFTEDGNHLNFLGNELISEGFKLHRGWLRPA